MRIEEIAIGQNPPHDVNVIIEVPIGGEPIKYEMDKKSGALFVDRFLYTAMRYPGNYSFIPHKLSEDGDPCDVIVANTREIVPGAVMNCRVVGVLLMEDEAGAMKKLWPSRRSILPNVTTRSPITPICRISRCSRSSISSRTTRIWNRANGSRSFAGAMQPKRKKLFAKQ